MHRLTHSAGGPFTIKNAFKRLFAIPCGWSGGDSEARQRFVVVRNPVEPERDRKKREDIVAEVERRLAQQSGEPHRKAACALRSHKVFERYVAQDEDGEVWQTNPMRPAVKKLLERLKIKPPPRFYAIKPAKGAGV